MAMLEQPPNQGIDAANAAVKPGEIDYVTRSRIEVTFWGLERWSFFDVQRNADDMPLCCTGNKCMYVYAYDMYVQYIYMHMYTCIHILLKGWRGVC